MASILDVGCRSGQEIAAEQITHSLHTVKWAGEIGFCFAALEGFSVIPLYLLEECM